MKHIPTKIQEIGVRELKAHVSDVMRAVQARHARYIVTQRGVPVAVIVPMDAVLPERSDGNSWNRLMEIRAKIGMGKQSKKSSIDILSEMRR